jgi:hypothetical protein
MGDTKAALRESDLPAEDFPRALVDAEELLRHASSNGLLPLNDHVAESTRTMICDLVTAREAARNGEIPQHVVIAFWVAYAQLAQALKPVTAASLAASRRISLAGLKSCSTTLVAAVIVFSIFLFMSNSTLKDTYELIEQQNVAALQLWSDVQMLASETGTARGVGDAQSGAIIAERTFSNMVEFSRKSAWLLQTASRLNGWFTPWWIRLSVADVSFNGEGRDRLNHLNVPPGISTIAEIKEEAINQIKAYQNIREFALALYKIDTLIYSSLSTYALPTVYALLGAFLYGFRLYSRLIRRMEYRPSAAHSARYFIAAIAGLVVGLFGSLLPKSFELPPLAIAFLVGYAVEAFFSRLDFFIRRLKAESEQPAPSEPRPAAAGAAAAGD